jgi:CHAT domain-containing protein
VLRLSAFPGSSRAFCLHSSLLFTGSIHEIDSSITELRHLLSILPRSDPRRPETVLSLAWKQFHRHIRSNQRQDLDNAIVLFAESTLLLPLPWQQHSPFILKALFSLACGLLRRSTVSKQLKDAIYAAKYFVHLRDQPHVIPDTPRHKLTGFLVCALAEQVELEAGNVMEHIREITVLSRELLALETSDVDTPHLTRHLCDVVMSKIGPGVPDQPLDELIECLRAARRRRPDLVNCRLAIAMCLACHYSMTNVNDDYEEAASILDEIIADISPGNSLATDSERAFATGLARQLAMMRSSVHQTPENLEEAIYRTQTCVSSSSFKKLFPYDLDPEATSNERFRYFGSIEGVEEPSDNSMSFEPLPVPGALEFSQATDKMKDLLIVIRNSVDTMQIHEVVEKARSMMASDLLRNHLLKTSLFSLFGDILLEAFRQTERIEYLNDSISARRQAMESPLSRIRSMTALPYLSTCLLLRFQSFPAYRTRDLDEAMELVSQCASTAHWPLPDRFNFACGWAFSARLYRHHTVFKAYDTALTLMQDTVLFSPTLQLQHTTLATHDNTRSLPLDYASYRVRHHQLKGAIETLERGRGLLWSEMRHLRAPVDQLLEVDPDLAHKFVGVNQNLEELTKSIPPSHKLSIDDSAPDGLRAVDPFGRLVLKQRDLLKERAKLISRIQALPGFDSFLALPSFDILRPAASAGPVIIINHSRWRSDILILLQNMRPSLIPTPDDFFKRAGTLKDKLLDSRRKSGLDSSDYEETLAIVLAQLYELVGKPVIDRLRQLQVPEQSRIWWCPTSVFCSLPLHAMGPIPSDDGETRYFLDLYICSYTPTLAALIQSRNHGLNSRSSDPPSVLLVAQPDSLPTVRGEVKVVQALESSPDIKVTSLISEAATPTTVIDGFHHHRFVHFACHGILETGKPFEAGFELHGDARLTLLDIVRAHLPTAEFAFLSACHTAEMTEGSIMDEGLHLAAAVQYCGFRSVVGTMWAMADTDGRDLAKYFYKALFSGSRGMSYHEGSAEALRSAVNKLRRKRGITLERWVNFVHYGA